VLFALFLLLSLSLAVAVLRSSFLYLLFFPLLSPHSPPLLPLFLPSYQVSAWVHEGELADPHHEFFVQDAGGAGGSGSSSSLISSASATSSSSGADLWRGRHVLDPSLVPSFLPLELAQQVLVLGKSLHFMRRACGDAQWVQGAIHKHTTGSSSSGGVVGGVGSSGNTTTKNNSSNVAEAWVSELRSLVESIGSATHARLLHVMENKFGLRTHLAALKKFLLLGQVSA
jgi:gamma-tubulin complex component 3